MIKLIDALRNVDKSDPSWVNMEGLAEALGVNYDYDQDHGDRFKAYYLIKWYCTDTWVGVQAIFLDDELVAMSKQTARKESEQISFVSAEAADKVRELIYAKQYVDLVESDMEVGPFYTVQFGSQLLTKEGFYNGKPVTVVRTWEGYSGREMDMWRTVRVNDGDNEFNIPVNEFNIPIHLTCPYDEI